MPLNFGGRRFQLYFCSSASEITMKWCGNLACWSCLMNHPKIHDRFSMLGLGKFVLGAQGGLYQWNWIWVDQPILCLEIQLIVAHHVFNCFGLSGLMNEVDHWGGCSHWESFDQQQTASITITRLEKVHLGVCIGDKFGMVLRFLLCTSSSLLRIKISTLLPLIFLPASSTSHSYFCTAANILLVPISLNNRTTTYIILVLFWDIDLWLRYY